jgi:hypothetical protein
MATPLKKIVPDRTDLGSFAAGATSGDTNGWNGWLYVGATKSVEAVKRVGTDPNHQYEVSGKTLAVAQAAAANQDAIHP